MSFADFQRKMQRLISIAGGGMTVDCKEDLDRGRHYAKFSNGVVVLGNRVSTKVRVQWGSGHYAWIDLSEIF